MSCTVMNLLTGEKLIYTCSPKEAVVSAFAQSKNDYNTWNYKENYDHLVEEGNLTFLCGDFSVFKDGKMF